MALPDVDCFTSLDRRDQLTAIYEALVEASGSEDLESADCFRGQDQRDQITNLYAAVLALTT